MGKEAPANNKVSCAPSQSLQFSKSVFFHSVLWLAVASQGKFCVEVTAGNVPLQ